MQFILFVIIFIILFILYLHIINEYKLSSNVEIYEVDYENKKKLLDTCNLKQPFIFKIPHFENNEYSKLLSNNNIYDYILKNEGNSLDMQLYDTNDFYNNNIGIDLCNNDKMNIVKDGFLLSLSSGDSLIKLDTESHIITENNNEIINENKHIYKYIKEFDEYLKPNTTLNSYYDIMYGSKDSNTLFRYHTNNSCYLLVGGNGSGKIRIKMTPYKYSKYLNMKYDYYNYDFYTDVNVWKPTIKCKDFTKIKFIEFDLYQNSILYIPPYWLYSIQYIDPTTIIYKISYNTLINNISNLHNITLYYLQQFNNTISYNSNLKKENELIVSSNVI